MIKADEVLFLKTLASERPRQTKGPFATDIGVRLGIPVKRAEYLLKKWSRRGWWNCGVSLRSGWLEAPGLEVARNL